MVSSETTAETEIDRSETGPIPWRRLFEHAVHTLLPSAVRMIGAGFQFLSTVMVARSLGDGPAHRSFSGPPSS